MVITLTRSTFPTSPTRLRGRDLANHILLSVALVTSAPGTKGLELEKKVRYERAPGSLIGTNNTCIIYIDELLRIMQVLIIFT
ncbi:hypothetical protein NUKP66_04620 [Klebsiella variicola]|nr:hypothetical protein NUKP66_04620 [Klebsiella variicola]